MDANSAGDGNLEIHVTADGESVANYVRQERDASFKVTFTPQRPVRHKVWKDLNSFLMLRKMYLRHRKQNFILMLFKIDRPVNNVEKLMLCILA